MPDDCQASLVELGKQLLAAARDGDTEGVRGLMARGAPFTADWLGTSPLHLTAQYGNFSTCQVLLRAGCSRDARTKVDKTPLHIAAQEGHSDICELLLMSGADVDARDLLMMTPLHWAVERGCVLAMEVLMKHGANILLQSKFDKTPLDVASDNGRPDLYEVLQNYEKYRPVGFDSGSLDMDIKTDLAAICEADGMTVSQQEEVQTFHNRKVLMSPEKIIEMNLDPVELALTSAGEDVITRGMKVVTDGSGHQVEEGGIHTDLNNGFEECLSSLDSSSNRNEEEALKLLEAHGITMLPEDDLNTNLSLTEAGRLALSSLSSPLVRPPPFLHHQTDGARFNINSLVSNVGELTVSSSVDELTLSSSVGEVTVPSGVGEVSLARFLPPPPPLQLQPRLAASNTSPVNPIRSINLSSLRLPSVSSPKPVLANPSIGLSNLLNRNSITKVVTLSSKNSSNPLASNNLLSSAPPKPTPVVNSPIPNQNKMPRVIKLTPEQFAMLKAGKSGRIILAGNKRETSNIALSSPPRKIAKMEELEELQRKKESELQQIERLKQELKTREEEVGRLDNQIEAKRRELGLSNGSTNIHQF